MQTELPDAMNPRGERMTQAEVVTTKDVSKWADLGQRFGVPIIIAAVIGSGMYYAMRADVTQAANDNTRQDVLIAQHHDEIIRMKADASSLRDSLKSLELQIDRRFMEMNSRLDSISSTLQAILMNRRAAGTE
jgi:hypothetical protein